MCSLICRPNHHFCVHDRHSTSHRSSHFVLKKVRECILFDITDSFHTCHKWRHCDVTNGWLGYSHKFVTHFPGKIENGCQCIVFSHRIFRFGRMIMQSKILMNKQGHDDEGPYLRLFIIFWCTENCVFLLLTSFSQDLPRGFT